MDTTRDTVRADASHEMLRNALVPVLIVERAQGLFMANQALAAVFGYQSCREVEELMKNGEFLRAHFQVEALAPFYEALFKNGTVHDWLLRGRSLNGRELTLEVSARASLGGPLGPADRMEAFLIEPCRDRDTEAFLQKARKEAELASKAKNEFLSNISHELRTPLNIIIGMLSMAVDDEEAGEELRQNLGLAKDAADGLFSIVNDLITLSNLEARRLSSDLAQFSPNLLLNTLARQFAAAAEAKGVKLAVDTSERGDVVLEGGYNLIVMALEKLLHNAIKFVADKGEVSLKADVTVNEGGPWLRCMVQDNGPGLDESLINRRDLFRQGDGSMNRRHGGLGLGLSLASSLTSLLGGRLILANREGGGAETGFIVPVKFSTVDYSG
ncbi:MAG: HAMP domain-containing histidine kinase [Candidatus Adiutrix sp.]|jgi:signal transduction histidine kinase|nr:HAMP domain-containing histidine kinase [Candidatus Adiutrix sp.]